MAIKSDQGGSDVREQLLALWEKIKTEAEGNFDIAADLLELHPDCADVFIPIFHEEKRLIDKELLADMVLRGIHYPPAIDFLRNEMGWTDFSGYAGFPKYPDR